MALQSIGSMYLMPRRLWPAQRVSGRACGRCPTMFAPSAMTHFGSPQRTVLASGQIRSTSLSGRTEGVFQAFLWVVWLTHEIPSASATAASGHCALRAWTLYTEACSLTVTTQHSLG